MEWGRFIRENHKTLYVATIVFVFATFIMVINGIGGWIVFFNKGDFLRDRYRIAAFLLALFFLMIYGLIKYDDHQAKLAVRFSVDRAINIRFKQILMVMSVCSLLLVTS